MAPRSTSVGDAYTPAYAPATSLSVIVATGAGALLGFGVAESTGTGTAALRLRDGTATSAPALTALITLGPNESVRDWFGPQGIAVATGVFVERVNGSSEVAIYGQ